MSRPTEFFQTGATIYWDVSIFDVNGAALDADVTPVVKYRIGGSNVESTAGITVTKENPPAGTQLGVYRVAHNLSSNVNLVNGVSIRYSEKATIGGVDYYNRWGTIVRTASIALVGAGSITYIVTVKSSGSPVAGVECWVTTDVAGTNVVAGTLTTDDFGIVTFLLEAGTYYLWRDSTTHSFPKPTTITVS